ncbi:MAG: magnesium transporter [Acidobacteriota bacterium]|nr:magnesium transporter [Acidobacteriota bacterium]
MPDLTTDHALLDELHTLLREGEEEALRIFLRLVRPEDIAEWLDLLSANDRQFIISALDHESAGTVLTDTTASIRAELVDDIEPQRLARIAEALPADEAADLIGELEVEETEEVLHHISTEDEEVLRQLLTYPEDTAGGIMNPDVVALQPDETVDDAIHFLRSVAEDTPIAAVYVVDEERTLLGFVRMRRMVTARPTTLLGDIMSTDVISVPVETDQEEVADIVEKYNFMAIPVVETGNRLAGVVTVDDILGVIEDEASEDIYKMAGSSIEEEESESILHVARYRLPWLLVCLAGTQLSSMVLVFAAREVALYEQMSIFTAAIMAMAGNTSLQSSTTTVRRLALDTLPRSRFLRHIAREILVALLMGIVCGAFATALALAFHRDPLIGLALGPAMAIGMSAASLLGAAMPMVLDIAGVDPAVASGPLVSTINDWLALAVYFSVATGMLVAIG